jgi:hypothetical protein
MVEAFMSEYYAVKRPSVCLDSPSLREPLSDDGTALGLLVDRVHGHHRSQVQQRIYAIRVQQKQRKLVP